MALFALALVLGVLGHPFSQHGQPHACDGQLDHLVAEDGHDHDEGACAACHLFQTLDHAGVVDAGPELSSPTREQSLLSVLVRAASPRTVLAYQGRGPPAV